MRSSLRLHSRWVSAIAITLAALLCLSRPSRAFKPDPYKPSLDVTVSPTYGTAPLSVHVVGGAWAAYYSIDMGMGNGGDLGGWTGGYTDDFDFDETFTYTCPGVYAIHGYAGVNANMVTYCDTVIVGGITPGPDLTPWVSNIKPEGSLYLQSRDAVPLSLITRSTVDWGDGSPVEDFVWTLQTNQWTTPVHHLAYYPDGTSFVATVSNYYEGSNGCALERTASVTWSVGVVTATETTTWGRIKALYR